MDTTPLPGFITRKQASERCKRAERTLQRYWSRAIELKKDSVLENLKLRTEDGEVIAGRQVTKAKIDNLKKKGKNPTWYVRASWIERTYGERLEAKHDKKRSASATASANTGSVVESRGAESPSQIQPQLIAVLQQQIADLKSDKEKLERDKQQDTEHHREDFKMLKEMFDTLKEDHEGTKKLLGKALDVGVEKLRQGNDTSRPSDDRSMNGKPVQPKRDQNVVDVNADSQSFLDRHLPTLSRPFRRK